MAKRYPDEAPVFRLKDGRHCTFRPALARWHYADVCPVGESINIDSCEPISDECELEWFDDAKPMTRAARELVAWVRQ